MSAVSDREWLRSALATLGQEAARSADTHLLRIDLPTWPDIPFYFKDEAAHPTGSLKHRLARSLFLYALCNGRLHVGQGVIDASSGSTAISEAWFARLLGLPFTAVAPRCTAPGKLRLLHALGAECHLVDDGVDACAEARRLADARDLCFLDQFALAERATDWRGNNNIADSIVAQMAREPQPVPHWVVCGAGTGGTSATLGRYLRWRGLDTGLCVAEPTGGAFARGWNDRGSDGAQPTLIEGIGRRHVEPGFLFDVVDAVEEVDDVESIAATWLLEEILGRRYGGSSGTCFAACLRLADAMKASGVRGPIVAILGDRGERYGETLYDRAWLAAHAIDPAPALEELRERCGLASRSTPAISRQ